jgi:hypothetical protein
MQQPQFAEQAADVPAHADTRAAHRQHTATPRAAISLQLLQSIIVIVAYVLQLSEQHHVSG